MPKNYNLFLKGFVGGWEFSSDMISYILDKNKDNEVCVLIDSLGGYTHEGLTISSLFSIHGNVSVHYVGMNASAATIASMGAKHISIDASAMYLVHKCSYTIDTWRDMNADEIAKFLEELNSQKQDLEKFDETVASLYARRCKKSKEELLALMAKGGWLTAKEAYDWGFVDEITNYEEDAAPIIDDNLATSMVSAGIPLPKSMPVKEDTGNKFLRAIKRALALLNEDNRATDTVSLDGSDNRIGVEVAPKNNNQSMKLELLSVAVGADITNEATLTADQLDKVEAAIKTSNEAKAQLEAKVESLNAQIADLNAKVEELGKQPGATTSDVTVKGGEAEAPGADAKADAQNLLKQLL